MCYSIYYSDLLSEELLFSLAYPLKVYTEDLCFSACASFLRLKIDAYSLWNAEIYERIFLMYF